MSWQVLKEPIAHPSAWCADDMFQRTDWIIHCPADVADEIYEATVQLRINGKKAPFFGKDDFVLKTALPFIQTALDDVKTGRGFILLRGLPIDSLDEQGQNDLLWGIGCYWGKAITQNKVGDGIATITDLGLDATRLDVKPSLTNVEQRPHSDPSDVVALMCIRQAKEGGFSRIASTLAIYNELLSTYSVEDLQPLYRGFFHDLRGDAKDDSPFGCTPFLIPIYRYFGGKLSSIFNAGTIKDAQRRRAETIPEHEMAVIDRIVELARSDKYCLEMNFEPGDIQLLNNYTTVHWRTKFIDYPEPDKRRKLYRLWLNVEDIRPLDPAMHRGYITGSHAGRTLFEIIENHAEQ